MEIYYCDKCGLRIEPNKGPYADQEGNYFCFRCKPEGSVEITPQRPNTPSKPIEIQQGSASGQGQSRVSSSRLKAVTPPSRKRSTSTRIPVSQVKKKTTRDSSLRMEAIVPGVQPANPLKWVLLGAAAVLALVFCFLLIRKNTPQSAPSPAPRPTPTPQLQPEPTPTPLPEPAHQPARQSTPGHDTIYRGRDLGLEIVNQIGKMTRNKGNITVTPDSRTGEAVLVTNGEFLDFSKMNVMLSKIHIQDPAFIIEYILFWNGRLDDQRKSVSLRLSKNKREVIEHHPKYVSQGGQKVLMQDSGTAQYMTEQYMEGVYKILHSNGRLQLNKVRSKKKDIFLIDAFFQGAVDSDQARIGFRLFKVSCSLNNVSVVGKKMGGNGSATPSTAFTKTWDFSDPAHLRDFDTFKDSSGHLEISENTLRMVQNIDLAPKKQIISVYSNVELSHNLEMVLKLTSFTSTHTNQRAFFSMRIALNKNEDTRKYIAINLGPEKVSVLFAHPSYDRKALYTYTYSGFVDLLENRTTDIRIRYEDSVLSLFHNGTLLFSEKLSIFLDPDQVYCGLVVHRANLTIDSWRVTDLGADH